MSSSQQQREEVEPFPASLASHAADNHLPFSFLSLLSRPLNECTTA